MSTYDYGTAIACYADRADVPVGATYVIDQRPDRTVWLVVA